MIECFIFILKTFLLQKKIQNKGINKMVLNISFIAV